MTELTLRWEKFGLSRGLHEMLGAGELVDVTLACQGEFLQAHKTVLAACSPHFRALFKVNPCQHPIVIMQDVRLPHLQALLNFMYQGEATVNQEELPGFLRTAEALRVSGLAPRTQSGIQGEGSTSKSQTSPLPATSSPLPPNKRPRHSREPGWQEPGRVFVPAGAGAELLQPADIKLEDEISLEEADDWPSCSEGAKDHSGQSALDENSSHAPHLSPQHGIWYEAGPSSSQAQPGTSQQVDMSSRGVASGYETWQPGYRARNTITHPGQHMEELTINPDMPPTGPVTCQICCKSLKNETSLRAHVASMHTNSVANNEHHLCVICNKILNSKETLYRHTRNYHGASCEITTCDICQRTFKNRYSLIVHIRLYHTGSEVGQRFECQTCGNTFGLRQDLIRHERNLHGEDARPHECPVCHKLCKSRRSLQQHRCPGNNHQRLDLQRRKKTS